MGNKAEQVVFALILDDTEAPFFNSKCQGTATQSETLFNEAITVEAVSDWELCKLQAIDNVDGNVDANIRYDVTYLGRNNDAFTNANTHIGFDHSEVGHDTKTMKYADARLYFTPYDAALCKASPGNGGGVDTGVTAQRYIVKDGVSQVKACGPE